MRCQGNCSLNEMEVAFINDAGASVAHGGGTGGLCLPKSGWGLVCDCVPVCVSFLRSCLPLCVSVYVSVGCRI